VKVKRVGETVEVADLCRVVKRGDVVDVPAGIGKALLAQGGWEAAKAAEKKTAAKAKDKRRA